MTGWVTFTLRRVLIDGVCQVHVMARRTAELPLHSGSAPRWLFDRMERLGQAIAEVIIHEFGQAVLLDRLADPFWFQAFGCVLGFDWHSSGLTTTTMGALKEALAPQEHGVAVVGGKGATSRKTPDELEAVDDRFNFGSTLEELKAASRLSAKVDNACIQDEYSLYHHTFVVTEDAEWCVVQQGMDGSSARRYHWRSTEFETYVNAPQTGICSMDTQPEVLDLVAPASRDTRQVSLDLVKENPDRLHRYSQSATQTALSSFADGSPDLQMPVHHDVRLDDLTDRSITQLQNAYEVQPNSYEELLGVDGIGPGALRALALIAELIYGTDSSWEDPAKYAWAHGGKDGTPHPVDRERYDQSITILQTALEEISIGQTEKRQALNRLDQLTAGKDATSPISDTG